MSAEDVTAGSAPLTGRLVDGEMPALPGGAVEAWHCGVPMVHEVSAMRWTVDRGNWRPAPGSGGQLLACPRRGARARMLLEVPEAGAVPARAPLAAGAASATASTTP